MTGRGRRIALLTVVGAALVVVLAAIAGTMLGVYNVAADAPDSGLVRLALNYARERSIDARAANITVPAHSKRDMISEGAEHYAEMCSGCHLTWHA